VTKVSNENHSLGGQASQLMILVISLAKALRVIERRSLWIESTLELQYCLPSWIDANTAQNWWYFVRSQWKTG